MVQGRSGQSLVGVMVTAGLLLIMVVGVMQLLDNSLKSQQASDISTDWNAVMVQMSQIFSSKTACTTAFTGTTNPVQASTVTQASCGTSPSTSIYWNGAAFISPNIKMGGLTFDKICIVKVDDSWSIGTRVFTVKLLLGATNNTAGGGAKTYYDEFFFNVRVDTSGNIVQCVDYLNPTTAPAATPKPCADPSSLNINSSNRIRNFTASWTAGWCNGGVDGCRIDYEEKDSSCTLTGVWKPLVYVNCDATHTNSPFRLPTDQWNGCWQGNGTTGPARAMRLRLVRRSDGNVFGNLGYINCTTVGGRLAASPTEDENCNGYWDDFFGGLYH